MCGREVIVLKSCRKPTEETGPVTAYIGNPEENLHSKALPPARKSEKKPTIQRVLLLVVGWLSTSHAEAPCGGKKCGVKGNPIEKMWRKGKAYRKNYRKHVA